jgi:lactaldehyde dehydrogenase/glycolaldehyde dehydrogenase
MDTMKKHYIDGEFYQPESSECINIVNPATEEEIEQIPVATKSRINQAFNAAAEAKKPWRKLPSHDRGNYLRDIADAVRENFERLVDTLVKDVGKPRRDAKGEVSGAIDYIEYMAEWDRRIEGDILPGDSPREDIHLKRHPYGVVAAISPWNFPVNVTVRKLAPALVTGNTVIIKPSEVAPLSVLELCDIIDKEVELPAGVINCICGGGNVGKNVIEHPDVDMITMTGSRATGKKIMQQAAGQLTPVSLELGGKAPAIVMDDASIDDAVEDLVNARIVNAGQGCACVERIYVQSGIADEFTEKYVDKMENIEIGDPVENPDMGPQVSEEELRSTESMVNRAESQGGEILVGGKRPSEGINSGYYYEPTVIQNVSQDMNIMSNETFGPVSPIMEFESVDQALDYANDSNYGLTSYVFTNDYNTAMRISNNLEFGETFVNRTVGASWQGHHIGWNESGVGGEDGKYGMLKYTRIKSVYHNYS